MLVCMRMETSPSPEQLTDELQRVVHARDGREEIQQCPALLNLQCVRSRAESDERLIVAAAAQLVLQDVCARLDTRARSARAILGLEPGTSGTTLTRRQRVAATALGMSADHFRRRVRGQPSHQDRLLLLVAQELYLLERSVRLYDVVGHRRPDPSVTRGYRITGAEFTYVVDERDHRKHLHKRSVEIEAVKPGVWQFLHWYTWTGRGHESPPEIKSPGHSLIGDPSAGTGWTYYSTHLGKELEVGERVTIEVEQELYDSEMQFQPFLYATVTDDRCERLVLRLHLPRDHPPSRVDCYMYNSLSPDAQMVGGARGLYDPRSGTVEWTPALLVAGHRYEIWWSYPNDEGFYPPGYAQGALPPPPGA